VDDLRDTVRELVANWDITPTCDAWMRGHDPAFSRAMAERGLIGITWPEPFGGGRSNLARLVVTEELLRVGAPVGAHWIADRQIGPAILRNGSPSLREELLPGIAAGEITFCLGMSETEAGSDLASVRTRAVRDGDGWRITGRKIWTTGAHVATHAYVLARTGDGADKHEGLTEFVVEMSAPGVTVRPIEDLGGEHHFNEVTFDDVFVPAGRVIGAEGAGWKQVTEQLSFERGGMERVLSTYPLLAAALTPDAATGALIARLMTLRELACRVAEAMDAGRAPAGEAAVLKYLGTTFERDVIEVARTMPGRGEYASLLAQAQRAAPGFSIRGGTDEMLLTVVSRQAPAPVVDDIGRMADDVLASAPDPWAAAVELGWTSVGVDESAGGSGGTFADLAALVRAMGRHGHALPLAETALARMPDASDERLTVLRVHAALGAVEGACRLTREHVTTRVQFGRPLNRLQAVAHKLAEMECARVLLEVAAQAALGLDPARVVAAAVVLDPVVTLVARLAHQLHGAMGITRESPLHHYTTLLWSLRDQVGPAREWAPRLCGDEPTVWAAVTTRP
jgi:alkylation response protein AidB-like acyl-CoA dehydrogenase